MSLVTPQHWEFWMKDMLMPEDCTFEMMFAMYDAIKKVEDKEYAAEQIAWYESLWRQYFPKYETAKEYQNTEYDEIMKLIKEGILFFRKWLTE